MTKKFGMIVSMTVAMLVASGSVAAIGANSDQEVQQAKSTAVVKKGTSQDARQTAQQASRQAGNEVVASSEKNENTAGQPEVSVNQAQIKTNRTVNDATQPTTVDDKVQPAAQTVVTKENAMQPVKAVQQTAMVNTGTSTNVTTANTKEQDSQVPAVEPRADAQGQATSAVLDYARQNGLNLSGLQVGTSAADNGGYDVIIRDKRLAEQGQGDGIQHQYYVDEQGKVTAKPMR